MATYTKPQLALMRKIANAEAGKIRPYAAEWTTFYKLKALGLANYALPSWSHVTLTDKGRSALAESAS